MKTWLLVLVCGACIFVFSPLAEACKYSVRDVGFVDLGSEPYRLICFYNGHDDKGFAELFSRIAQPALADSNLSSEAVDVTQRADHPALKNRGARRSNRGPELAVVAPDPAKVAYVVDGGGFDSEAELTAKLKHLLSSPLRNAILDSILQAYAVVVVVEGESAAENRRAAQAARFAVAQLTEMMQTLDKPVGVPPKTIVLPTDQAQRERMLLWSWGLDAQRRSEPSIVVLFGRGRRLGPVMSGSDISGTELLDRLALVGKSCECELDRSWMQGPMFPHAWDATQQADAAKSLGFDAESPLVKVEISRIIARGPRNRPAGNVAGVDAIDPLLGYGEIDVDQPLPSEELQLPAAGENQSEVSVSKVAVSPAVAPQTSQPPGADERQLTHNVPSSVSAGMTSAVTIGLLLVIAVAGGVLMYVRMRGQA